MTKKKWWPYVYQYVMVFIGSFIYSVGIDAFVLPHHLVSSGISGVSLLLYYMSGIQVGTWNIILNLPIVWATWKYLGKSHVVMAIYGTLAVSWTINGLMFMADWNLVNDPIVAALLAGVLNGLGLGIVYRVGGNTGGLDPIAMIVRKYYGLQIGTALLFINGAILIAAGFQVGVEAAAITLISLYVFTMTSNKVVTGFGVRKVAFIITARTNEVCDTIINKLGRGATILEGVGAYTRKPKQVILVAVNLMQVNKLKEAVDVADDQAFMLITDAAEVIGAGFTKPVPPKELVARLEAEREAKEMEDEQLATPMVKL